MPLTSIKEDESRPTKKDKGVRKSREEAMEQLPLRVLARPLFHFGSLGLEIFSGAQQVSLAIIDIYSAYYTMVHNFMALKRHI